jgi:hypothetical protein
MPRRRLFSLLAAVGMLGALAATPVAVGAAGGGDSASGNFTNSNLQVDFSARASNVDTDARGRIRVTNTATDPNDVYTADVTCIRVVGATGTTPATAVVSGRIVDQPPGSPYMSLLVQVQDSGKFSQVPDSGFVFFQGTPSPPDGACPVPFMFNNPLAEGTVTIDNTLP